MKNKTKFLAPALLSLTMLITASGFSAVNAADTAVITIEGESSPVMDSGYMVWTADTPVNVSEYSGGKYANIRTASDTVFDSEKAVFSYSFDVESAGSYELSLVSTKPNAPADYASYAVSVDDGEFIEVTGENKIGGVDGDKIFSAYALKNTYPLEKGPHKVTFKLLDNKNRADGRAYVFLDYVRFTQTGSFDQLVIKGDDSSKVIENNAVGLYSEQQGSNFYPVFKTGQNAACPEGGVNVAYKVHAEYEGLYRLTITANQYNGGLSTYAVGVNDREATEINAASIAKSSAVEGVIYKYETNLYYILNKGENTVNFKILKGRTSDNRVYCFLDRIELERVSENTDAVVYGTDLHTHNAADIYWDGTEVEGGLTIKTNPNTTFPADGVVLTYSMYAPESGSYKLTAAASVHTDANWSSYAVAVNGGEYVDINEANADSSSSPNGGWSVSNTHNQIAVYNTTAVYKLNKGMNTVSFKLTSPRTDGRGFAVLEYLRFKPAEITDASYDIDYIEAVTGDDASTATAATFIVTPGIIDGETQAISSVTVEVPGKPAQTKDSTVISGAVKFGIIVDGAELDKKDITITIE